MAEFVSARVYELRAQMKIDSVDQREKVTLLERLLDSGPGGGMSDLDAISEAMGHM